MAKRKAYDWEAIEKDYRAGQLSIREIAKAHGCSDTAIRKKMKTLGVERDLSEQVAQRARAELVRAEVRTANPEAEKEIVETAAARVVEVVRSHRTAISSGRKVVEKLTLKLSDAANEEGNDRLQSHASTAVSLSAALKNLVVLERQAFSIKDEVAEQKVEVTGLPKELAEMIGALNG